MVAGMAAPAYADVYYIGDGNITITKDEKGDVYVKHANSKDPDKGDLDNGEITIKGGKRSEDTPAPGSGSSEGTTPAKSSAKSMSATPISEDSENNDMVYLGDTKGSGEENKNQSGDTTGGEKNETDFTKKTQPSRSPVLESQITYTGPSLKVADANDDEETRDESTTALKTAAENFRNTAENVTNYVIRIINKVKDSTLNVTLEDVNIKANNDAALSVEGAGNTTITLKGDNTLTSDGKHAGLEHNEKSDGGATTGKLTITSETDKNGNNSSLTATGSGGSAGIGSAWSKSGSSTGAGTIEIVGGDIKAIGASSAAGIGSGYGATSDTDIIISGTAKIEAESTYGGAGIGSGKNSTGETNIIIKSGTITKATGGKYGGAGIGSGSSDTKDDSKKGVVTINITGGTITEATGGSDYVSSSKRWYSGAGIGSGTYRDGTADNEKGAVTINIKDNAHIVSATGGSDSTSGGAGIGGGLNSGKSIINILKGTIGNVIGGRFAAGIGSGQSSKSEVNISGGTLQTVTGGACGAGIGGGFDGSSSDVTITGGTLQIVTGGAYGAGIGSGYYGGSSTVNISGNAKLKNVTGGEDGGAGIGSGYSSSSSSVTISGGTVNAAGNQYSTSGSSGIGGNSTDVTISGGNITATGYGTGAGIGSYDDNSSNITITGGTIIANGTGEAPAIGGGSVSISNADAPLDITATAPDAANAIQSSDGKKLDKVIQLAENGRSALVRLVKSGSDTIISRLFHNGAYAANHSTFHSHDRVTPEMSEAEKAKYGDIASVHNWKVSDRQEPNCGKDGYIEYTCMVDHCGTTFRHTLPATGQHTWNEGVVTKEPTCTELGVRTFTCTVCHNTRTEDIEAPGHEYGEWVIDRDATCIEEGSKHRDCIRSDATQTESIPATGQHQWKLLSTTAATCGQDGTVTYKCAVCGDTKTETLNATGQHSYGAGVVTKAATCAEPGIMTYTCVVCNDSYTESIPVDKSTHKWDAGVVTKEPTCTADGVRTFTCSVCGDTRTEAIKALGHEYGEWVIDRDATCVEEGSKHRDCIRGDDTQTEAIPVSKTHTFGEWVITKEPTCTEKGERQRSCTISGCVVTETEELPALGHQWSDWTPVKGDSSREYRICEVCNEVEYRDVSHNSDSSISTGLRVLDPAQANIIQNVQLVQLSQINHTLYIHVAQETASLQGDLSDLTDLRSENIKTVVFSTVSCTSTLSLSDVAALGAGSTPFALSHSGSTATFTVGGADHSALLR